jgi:diguanylate cyclase (GGDEF)-like protein
MHQVPSLADLEHRFTQARADARGTPAELAALVELAARLVRTPGRRAELAREGAVLATTLAEDVAQLRCRAMVAEFVARQENPAEALPDALDVLAEARRTGDPLALAMAHHTLAMCFHLVDCVSESIEHAYHGLYHYRAAGDCFGEGRVLSVLGDLFFDLGERAAAQPLYQQAHDLFLDCDDPSGAGMMLSDVASIQRLEGDPAAAGATYERSLELFEQAGMPLDAAVAMRGYAAALADLDQRELADVWLKRAASHNRLPDGSVANPTYEIKRLLVAARSVQVPRGDLAAARDTLEQAARIASEQGAVRLAADAEAALAEVLRQLDDLAGAYDHSVRSRVLTDELARASHDRRVRALRVRFEVEQVEREARLYRERSQAQTEIIAELERTRAELADRMADLQRLNAEVLHLSQTDPLTGIANRRHMNETLARLCRTTSRYRTPLALAMLDVDRFKSINDLYGHEVGDNVLVSLTDVVRRQLRASDVPARLGGDEFVVVMPGVTGKAAVVACRRLHAAVRDHPWEAVAPGLVVTVTVGVIDGTGQADPSELLRQVDRALYRGKQAGRDVISH